MKTILLAALVISAVSVADAQTSTERTQQYEQAERQAAKLAEEIRRLKSTTTPNEIRMGSLFRELRIQVLQAFDLRMQIQQSELDEVEAALKASRVRLARRAEIADAIIQRRMQELESGQDLSWLPSANDASSELATHRDSSQTRLANTFRNSNAKVSSYEMYLRDRIGALKHERNRFLRGVTECQQALVEAQNKADRLAKASDAKSNQTQERRKAERMVSSLSVQIKTLRAEVKTADDKIALLEKKVFDARQHNSDFTAIKASVIGIADGRIKLSIGSLSGLEKGMRLNVFREDYFVDEIEIVEVQTASSVGIVDADGDAAIRIKDIAILLLDPRLTSIVGFDPGESIYNEHIKRFKFHMPHGVGDPADYGRKMMRLYLGDPNHQPIYGIWGDPSNDSVIVIAPATSETAIREFLVKGEVMMTTGFDMAEDDDSLDIQKKKLLFGRRVNLIDLAHWKMNIVDLEAIEKLNESQQERLDDAHSDMQYTTKMLDIIDRKLQVVNELIVASESGTADSKNVATDKEQLE